MLIFAIRYSRSFKTSPRYIRKRSYKYFDQELFISAVQKLSWLDLYLCEDVDADVETFTGKIPDIVDEKAPMKTFQDWTNVAPWLYEKNCKINEN